MSMKICPYHRATLGVSFGDGRPKCQYPFHELPVRSKGSGSRARKPNIAHGMSSTMSKIVPQFTGKLVPVGTGKIYFYRLPNFKG